MERETLLGKVSCLGMDMPDGFSLSVSSVDHRLNVELSCWREWVMGEDEFTLPIVLLRECVDLSALDDQLYPLKELHDELLRLIGVGYSV